jgi:hypothetical protein
VRYISGEEIHRVLTFPAVVEAMEAAHRRPRMESGDLSLGDEKAHYFVRSAIDRGRALGSKLFTSFPDNLTSASGLPAVQAAYVLFETRVPGGVVSGRVSLPHPCDPVPVGPQAGGGQGARTCSRQEHDVDVSSDPSEPR